MYKAFLLKYGEIGVKGKNRHLFEDALVASVERALEKVDGEFTVTKESGRIYANAMSDFDYDDTLNALKKVFGLVWICPVVQIEDNGYEDLSKKVIEYIEKEYASKNFTFKVDSRRARKNYPLNSMELNEELGHDLLEAFPELKVDVHNPDVLVSVEIRNVINIYSKEIKGLGGMPSGSAGSAMLLLSGGIDSPVAGYMVSKRGVKLCAAYFHAPPYTSERAKQKVVELAEIVSGYAGQIRLYVIDFTQIQLEIYKNCPHDEMTIIMRRFMMRIAQTLAKNEGCTGLITGESIGQVASQTMQGLLCTNAVCELPVFRPLIAFDKQDIVEKAMEIGTYETSIQPFEDCCTIFVAKHPVTKPRLDAIERHEKRLEGIVEELLEKAIESAELLVIE